MDFNQTYYGDLFTIHTNIELPCIPATNIMLYINYIVIKKYNK